MEIRRLMNTPVDMPGSRKTDINGNKLACRGDTLVGNSPQMQEVYKGVGRVARLRRPIGVGRRGRGRGDDGQRHQHHAHDEGENSGPAYVLHESDANA